MTPFERQLLSFLFESIRLFHYQASDIEWAWDGTDFFLLQIRPVTAYGWHRCLTSANLDEILPKQVSRLMEEGQTTCGSSYWKGDGKMGPGCLPRQ